VTSGLLAVCGFKPDISEDPSGTKLALEFELLKRRKFLKTGGFLKLAFKTGSKHKRT
jgi:hypothetical protein